jgi:hypothetical protein
MPEQWGITQPIASAQNLPFIFSVILSRWQIPTGHHRGKMKKDAKHFKKQNAAGMSISLLKKPLLMQRKNFA